VIYGDLFEAITEGELFDLIIFNCSTKRVVDRFITSAPKYLKKQGYILHTCHLPNIEEILRQLTAQNLNVHIIDVRKTASETINLIKAQKTHKLQNYQKYT